MKKIFYIFFLFSLVSISFSQLNNCPDDLIGFDKISCLFCDLRCEMQGLLAPIAFLLVVMAAIIYAASQLGDAQLRSKGQSWAVMAIVGAILAFVLFTIGPIVMESMFGDGCAGDGWDLSVC
ncbi:hypothetical protein KO465_02365 [Candidatus Micrarchaeota archaeon]|jgi:hypothetical protein|nr:hypothetical protein [Candidatus Micrarchaeota archaeon]